MYINSTTGGTILGSPGHMVPLQQMAKGVKQGRAIGQCPSRSNHGPQKAARSLIGKLPSGRTM